MISGVKKQRGDSAEWTSAYRMKAKHGPINLEVGTDVVQDVSHSGWPRGNELGLAAIAAPYNFRH